VCFSCGALNKAEATHCSNCQAELDKHMVDKIIETRAKSRKEWYEERRVVAIEQKRQEEEASQKRMEAFWAEEQARREALARARIEREQRERKTLVIVGIVVGIIVLLLIAATLIVSLILRPPERPDEATWMLIQAGNVTSVPVHSGALGVLCQARRIRRTGPA
jgi:hypothetical protein